MCYNRCFPTKWPSYFGIITPFSIVYIFNTVMFFIILFSVLRHGNKDGKETKLRKLLKKAIITFVLAMMFGVGWVFGVLGSTGLPETIRRPSQILFVIIVGFQGLLIFLLHPCRSRDARQEWKKWFFYATCRSKAYHEHLKLSKQFQARSSDHPSGPTKQSSLPSITPKNPKRYYS